MSVSLELASALRAYRTQHNMTQTALGKLCNVSTACVSGWEQERFLPRPQNISILIALGIQVPIELTPLLDGPTIRSYRTAHGYTQRELAELLSVNHSTVSSWEIGRKQPSPAATRELITIGCPIPGHQPRSSYRHKDSPPTTPHECSSCPKLQECTHLTNQSLWCLCEKLPPTLADLVIAYTLAPDAYDVTKDAIHQAVTRIPDPIETKQPWLY